MKHHVSFAPTDDLSAAMAWMAPRSPGGLRETEPMFGEEASNWTENFSLARNALLSLFAGANRLSTSFFASDVFVSLSETGQLILDAALCVVRADTSQSDHNLLRLRHFSINAGLCNTTIFASRHCVCYKASAGPRTNYAREIK